MPKQIKVTLPHDEGVESHRPFSRQVKYFCPFIVVPNVQEYSAMVEEPLVVIVTVPFAGWSRCGHEAICRQENKYSKYEHFYQYLCA